MTPDEMKALALAVVTTPSAEAVDACAVLADALLEAELIDSARLENPSPFMKADREKLLQARAFAWARTVWPLCTCTPVYGAWKGATRPGKPIGYAWRHDCRVHLEEPGGAVGIDVARLQGVGQDSWAGAWEQRARVYPADEASQHEGDPHE